MQVQLGEQILTSDGQEAGRVEKVILDPNQGKVDSVVLRKGAILPHDVEVTVDRITEDAEGNHRIALGSERLDELKPFDETRYTAPPLDVVLPYDNPRDSVLWPAGMMGPPIKVEMPPFGGDRELAEEVVAGLYEQDLDHAVVAPGSAIMSRDGKRVGELVSLTFSETDGRLSRLVIRQGFLLPTELEVSGSLVESAGDGVLYLNVDSEVLQLVSEAGDPER